MRGCDPFFKVLNATGWAIAFTCHLCLDAFENEFWPPAVAEPCLNPRCGAAPGGGNEVEVVSGKDSDFVREVGCLRTGRRTRGTRRRTERNQLLIALRTPSRQRLR